MVFVMDDKTPAPTPAKEAEVAPAAFVATALSTEETSPAARDGAFTTISAAEVTVTEVSAPAGTTDKENDTCGNSEEGVSTSKKRPASSKGAGDQKQEEEAGVDSSSSNGAAPKKAKT